MQEERIWSLIARKLANEATEEELQELESSFLSDPELRFRMEMLYDWWKME